VPGKEARPLPYSPSKSYTVPRPIGWLSIVSKDGVINFAPYSQCSNRAFDPPMVMLAGNRLNDGRRKDRVINVEEVDGFEMVFDEVVRIQVDDALVHTRRQARYSQNSSAGAFRLL
jgi:flavin reductase (DIM6/NTAB) family NADH-FMN oxidoreductase RutF